MSVRRLHSEQPDSFKFTKENLVWAKAQLKKFPKGRQQSAVIPLLWRGQEQEQWVSEPMIEFVAQMLDMPKIRVLEVVTFYTMFQMQPVGKKAHIQVCGTTPCMLRGSRDLINVCKKRIAEHAHDISEDGNFSWEEVECLGACVNAPMVQIFKDTYEDLTVEIFEKMLDDIDADKDLTPGPQNGRTFAMAATGQTTLLDVPTKSKKAAAKKAAAKKAPAKKAAPKAAASGAMFTAPKGAPDNLKQISGVGPVIEKKLHALGITKFAQVAKFTKAQAAEVDDRLAFKGRIAREDWIGQAKILAKGGETEFSKRVAKGKTASSTKKGA